MTLCATTSFFCFVRAPFTNNSTQPIWQFQRSFTPFCPYYIKSYRYLYLLLSTTKDGDLNTSKTHNRRWQLIWIFSGNTPPRWFNSPPPHNIMVMQNRRNNKLSNGLTGALVNFSQSESSIRNTKSYRDTV